MKRLIVAATTALACTWASAGEAGFKVSNISVTSTDPSLTFLGGSLSFSASTGVDSVGKTIQFASWPLDSNYSASVSNNNGAASISYGPSFFDVFASSHSYDTTFGGGATLLLNYQTTPMENRADRALLSFSADFYLMLGADFEASPAGVQSTFAYAGWDINPVPGQDQSFGAPYQYQMGGDSSYFPDSAWDETLSATGRQVSRTSSISGYTGRVDADGKATVEIHLAVLGRGAANPVSPVPEPSTYTLMAAGLGMLALVAHRRTAANQSLVKRF